MTQLPMAQLEALYERAPKVKCKGLCGAACTGIGMSPAEWRRMVRRGGPLGPPPLKLDDATCVTTEERCRYLTADGRCSVYDVRPMICRLWGGTDLMPCPHGCEVEGHLEEPEGLALLQDAMRAGGTRGRGGDHVRNVWHSDEHYRRQVKAMMGRANEVQRRQMLDPQ